ncbi:hypothetical protein FOZ63_031642 [Perkinsus olseni]|uniref:Cytochrome P450 n=1 Tax=Perkinsus olseni TaxID=32597 RepID=A0A7J6Q517_PEROL|nr:hypothetical protein FOZ63_031642 [Perkinsus olseni]
MQRRAEGGECRRSDLLSKLLQLDKRALEGNIVTILFAGTETTSAALAWSLYYLCLYPDAQARAREEVDTLGHDPDTDDDLDKLPFVESCILETLRLKSPAPVIVNETIANVSVCGHEVPVGSWIVALTGKQMRSNAEGGSFFRCAVPPTVGVPRWFKPMRYGIANNHLVFWHENLTPIVELSLAFWYCYRYTNPLADGKIVKKHVMDVAHWAKRISVFEVLRFVPRSSEHFVYGLEILVDKYGDAYAIAKLTQNCEARQFCVQGPTHTAWLPGNQPSSRHCVG